MLIQGAIGSGIVEAEAIVGPIMERHGAADLPVPDIGCGTGLAPDSLLKAAVGSRIRAINLLDISRRCSGASPNAPPSGRRRSRATEVDGG